MNEKAIAVPVLLPCPFCGGKAIHKSEVHINPVIDKNGAYVDADTYYFEETGCPACNMFFFIERDDEPEEITIEKWNRRAEIGT